MLQMKVDPLLLKGIAGLTTMPVVLGLPLFLAAGTFNYLEAWIFIAVFTLSTTLHTLFLFKADRALLERRMRAGPTAEKRPEQKLIMLLMISAFFLIYIVAGLDHRFRWSHVPLSIAIIGNVLIAASYAIFVEVFRENSFASATIEVADKQEVVSTGLYGIVRHPMYAGAAILTISIPLALGSLWAFVVAVLVFPVLHWRIVDEEKFLLESLNGYREYCAKVPHRLIPGLY